MKAGQNIMDNEILNFTERLIPISDFSKGKTSRIFDDVKNNNTEYIVLKNNQPTAMVISLDSYRELVEKASKMETLLDKIEEIRLFNIASARSEKAEKTKDFEDVISEFGFTKEEIFEDMDDVRIIKCTDTEAANIVIKSNLLQRDKILPSERAKMYVLRNEYLKKDKYGSLSTGWTKVDEYTQNILAKEFDVSKSSIYEYIRLNNLIDDLLVLVDSGKIKIKIAVSLSYFPSGSQDVIYQYVFKDKKAVLNNEYIKRMKKYKHNITNDILEQITTALKKSKNTEKRYVDTFIKKYVRHFKSEQELIERIEILMVDYLERKDN